MESENDHRTEVIECHGKGYKALKGQILQNRYLIGDFIDEGGQGKIYSVVDTKKDSEGKIPLVIKLSEDYESVTEEISILKKLRKEQKRLYGADFRGYTPHCVNFGMLVLSNQVFEKKGLLSPRRKDSKSKQNEEEK